MKTYNLKTIIFLSLCCDLGLLSKRLISPLANIVTDALHIPGGIGTAFSLMFLVIAATVIPVAGSCTIMSIVQSVLALGFGMVGSMGALSPIGYVLPGVVIDLMTAAFKGRSIPITERMVFMNAVAAPCAALVANFIVFRLHGVPLALYMCVSATSGALCGLLGSKIVLRVKPVIGVYSKQHETTYTAQEGFSYAE